MTTVISVENLSKVYRLGQIGTGTFAHDLNVWWARARGKPNPQVRIGDLDEGNRDGEELWALRDVSFTVKQGEVLGIIGSNGAGKSTLLKILSRVTAPTSGRVKIKGRIASLLEVGTGFHPEMTGRENIFLNGAILGMTREEIANKFDEIVDFSGIEKFINTPVKRYSSGMYVRLAFAVAAHLDPEILVVDEVLAVGDAEFQNKCLGKMGDIAGEGRTVLFVSHNMRVIHKLCSRSLLLINGQLSMDGETDQIIGAYLSDREESGKTPESLELVPRQDGLGALMKFTKCVILNSKGEVKNHVLFGEKFSIYLETQSQEELSGLSVVVGIDSFIENRITTVASEDNNIFFSASPNQPLSVRVHLDDLRLRPGVYLITLGLRQGTRGIDHLPHVIRLEVVEASDEDEIPYPGTWGDIHIVAHWESHDLLSV